MRPGDIDGDDCYTRDASVGPDIEDGTSSRTGVLNGPALETPVLLTGIVVDINISSGDEAEEVTFEGEEADADVIRRDRGRTFPVLPVTADSVPVSHSKLNLRPTWSEYELDASRIPVKQIVDDFAENLTDAAD